MKVAVITPYHCEPEETLLRCCRSVAEQSMSAVHFLVADGFPEPFARQLPVRHITLPTEHRDNGNAARAIGALCALNEGFDLLAFLDADNWYEVEHIQNAAETGQRTNADIVFAPRNIWLANGMFCPFEDDDIIQRRTADTSSIVLRNRGRDLATLWGLMPKGLSPICDRVIIASIAALNMRTAWTTVATVNYESRWPAHYAAVGLPPPSDFHETDWETVETTYSPLLFKERFGFDPFAGVGPRPSTHKPAVIPVEDQICE